MNNTQRCYMTLIWTLKNSKIIYPLWKNVKNVENILLKMVVVVIVDILKDHKIVAQQLDVKLNNYIDFNSSSSFFIAPKLVSLNKESYPSIIHKT